ncbi:hypothetical protein [Spirillospora sp. CA-294931]|uniref:hypothetical protein n=1 Tax=Spirillospora sp. CA-294931 TaxID=3240042 RepID=UPI003D90452B
MVDRRGFGRALVAVASGGLMMSMVAVSARAELVAENPTYPKRIAGWSMDETSGRFARAMANTETANPAANIKLYRGVVLGEPGNLGPSTDYDRALRFNGDGQYGVVKPVEGADGRLVPIVDTSKAFMFSTWVKLASTSGEQVAVSQRAADGTVFEMGWFGDGWKLRHRKADGTVLASVSRDMAQAPNGTPWTEHWVSLMGGYDPVANEIWLRSQAEGSYQQCVPNQPWNCQTKWIMPSEIKAVPVSWTAAPGVGALLFGGTFTSSGRGSYWNGWIDDSQLWPITRQDESLLYVICHESVPKAPGSDE